MKDLVKSDPKMALDVQKEFAKERMQAAAQEKKLNSVSKLSAKHWKAAAANAQTKSRR